MCCVQSVKKAFLTSKVFWDGCNFYTCKEIKTKLVKSFIKNYFFLNRKYTKLFCEYLVNHATQKALLTAFIKLHSIKTKIYSTPWVYYLLFVKYNANINLLYYIFLLNKINIWVAFKAEYSYAQIRVVPSAREMFCEMTTIARNSSLINQFINNITFYVCFICFCCQYFSTKGHTNVHKYMYIVLMNTKNLICVLN